MDPYAMNDDGTAKDPKAFKEALLANAGKMEALEKEPEVLKIVQGDDIHAFQELIKSVYQASNVQSEGPSSPDVSPVKTIMSPC